MTPASTLPTFIRCFLETEGLLLCEFITEPGLELCGSTMALGTTNPQLRHPQEPASGHCRSIPG